MFVIRSVVDHARVVLGKIRQSVGAVPVHISLFILVPFIFGGLSFLAFFVAYHESDTASAGSIAVAVVVILFAILSGLAITVSIVAPLRRFVDALKESPAIPRTTAESTEEAFRRGDFSRFGHVFQEVTDLISKVDARERFPDIVGQSAAIRAVLSQIIKVAPTETTVLILGESGVGKECIADAIHRESRRLGKPCIKLNCVAIPPGLLESELFGHERGAFTGAHSRKAGTFELAHGGTLFLDEIGDMPLETQAKLLRVLQERRFERLGGSRTIEVDVRFVAASNKNLQRMVLEGAFREDLYYRLNVFSIYIPPLRERVEDVPLLARHFLLGLPGKPELDPQAMRELMTWPWPGNVRELKNVLERAAVMCGGKRIETVGLGPKQLGLSGAGGATGIPVGPERPAPSLPDSAEAFSLDGHLAAYERDLIVRALKKTGGVQAQAARILGINQRSLWHRIKKYEIDIQAIKNGDTTA